MGLTPDIITAEAPSGYFPRIEGKPVQAQPSDPLLRPQIPIEFVSQSCAIDDTEPTKTYHSQTPPILYDLLGDWQVQTGFLVG